MAKAKDIIDVWRELNPNGGPVTVSAEDIATIVAEYGRLNGVIKDLIIERNAYVLREQKRQEKPGGRKDW